ncbi:MAG: ABC transporter ATP-binding protein [Gammaproteobacteria bacterium]
MPALLDIQDLAVAFHGEKGSVSVLNGVSFTLEAGETLGIVGESGSGKTVLVRAILGLLQSPWRVERGKVVYAGNDLVGKDEDALQRIRGKEIALTTPEPRKHLNPLLTIGEQIVNVVQAHSQIPRKAALARAAELLTAVGIPDPKARLQAYPHELSGGMCQRVVIAMALVHSAKLLLADEPTAGLDVTISRQILDLMHDLVRDFNSALVLVSRDLGVIAHYCQRVAVMYAGQVVEIAKVPAFFAKAAHPYSRHLIRAAAAARDSAQAKAAVRAAAVTGAGCAFARRCPLVVPPCAERMPDIEPVAEAHWARCLRRHEIAAGAVTA